VYKRQVLKECGAVICAASEHLAPADRRIYALRDVTATVESIPLISASIMSKKIAEGTRALVLDVKVGTGAFMKTVEQARELATTMVAIGNDAGVTTRALLTDMNIPLGRTAGNALEVRESLEVLAGGGPADVIELTVTLAREMLDATGAPTSADPADVLKNGKAMDIWKAMISAQGGDVSAPLPTSRFSHEVVSDADGYLTHLDALSVGVASWRLGAGRARKEDVVQAGAGIEWHAGLGDLVTKGQKLFTLHTDDEARFELAMESLSVGYSVGNAPVDRPPLIIDRIV
jgi:thymidine phosphorylase